MVSDDSAEFQVLDIQNLITTNIVDGHMLAAIKRIKHNILAFTEFARVQGLKLSVTDDGTATLTTRTIVDYTSFYYSAGLGLDGI
jgi:hypothetical protein